MTLRPGSQSERGETSVTRRGSLLAAAGLGATIFGLPAASHADSFEEFMRKKQAKERMVRLIAHRHDAWAHDVVLSPVC